MTMEEYFVKELQEKKDACEKLENRVADLDVERLRTEEMIREIEWLVKKTNPSWTSSGAIIMEFAFFSDDDVKRALAVFARLGVDVKQERLTGEVEKR